MDTTAVAAWPTLIDPMIFIANAKISIGTAIPEIFLSSFSFGMM